MRNLRDIHRLGKYASVLFILLLPLSASSLSGCSNAGSTSAGTDRACCRGLVPECAACEEGLSLGEWLEKTCPNGENNAFYGGWDAAKQTDLWICENS